MASRADDPQFDFKAPEENIKKVSQPKKWEASAFQGVSPMDFYVRQNNEKKKIKDKERESAAKMYAYKAKGPSDEEAFAKKVNAQHAQVKQAKKDTVEAAKHTNISTTAELEARKKDFTRDQNWKQTQRDEKAKTHEFDMARSLFGNSGGEGPVEPADEEEMEE